MLARIHYQNIQEKPVQLLSFAISVSLDSNCSLDCVPVQNKPTAQQYLPASGHQSTYH